MTPQTHPNDDPDARIVQLESLIMHLQRDIEQLSRAILDQNTELDRLRVDLSRLEARFDEDDAEERDPLSERPPHY
ncbi:MAG: hypothetical protein DWQ34_19745 [Planctomycetota bacterium]|nr:MAG: hypothetical protein DWQ34_19745 [Planctomycetota bacterium]REJ92580.1 MAG: hypothetical protein DWQ29_04575 [Planctomycetota bacterium]REK28943.1 MAG: hypothetical protein DWQ41_05175 [Planctomycetota bacterium]REK39623.1 MAG: hypothetical protein DWQ45_01770 [Planctomycetota bacterium]